MFNKLLLWRRRLSRKQSVFLLFLSGLIVFLVLLPVALKFIILSMVSTQNIGTPDLADIDINVFTGEVSISNISLDQKNSRNFEMGRIYLNYGWLGLLERDYRIQLLAIESVRLNIFQDKNGVWNVLTPLVSTEGNTNKNADDAEQAFILPKIDARRIEFKDFRIQVEGQQLKGVLQIDDFELIRLSSWRKEPAVLNLKARWNDAPINIQLDAEFIKDEPTVLGDVVLNHLKISDVKAILKQLTEGRLSDVEGYVDVKLGFKGIRDLQGFLAFDIDTNMSVKQLTLVYDDYAISNEVFQWQGNVLVDNKVEGAELSATGDITSNNLKIVDKDKKLELLSLDELAVSELIYNKDRSLSVVRTSFMNVDLLRSNADTDSWLRTGNFVLSDIDFHGQDLSIKNIELNNGQYEVFIDENGELLVTKAIGENSSEKVNKGIADSQASQQGVESASIILAIDKFEVTGDSYIDFQDKSISPSLRERISIDRLTLNKLNQKIPDSPSPIVLKAKVGEFSTIDIDGWVTPFSETTIANLKGEVEALSIPMFSPYAEKAMGYQIPSGQLDYTFHLNLGHQILDMSNTVKLRHFDLVAVDDNKASQLSDSLGVSLGLGLDLMRDSDNAIQLKVPIKGALNDPNIDVKMIITKAIGKAVSKGSLSYLKYAIQPYGALLVAGDMLNKQLSAVSFEPIKFQQASIDLDEESKNYLDKMSELLLQRPGIELKVCGHVSDKDIAVLSQRILEAEKTVPVNSTEHNAETPLINDSELVFLARERGNNVKRYLLDRSVNSRQLIQCKPSAKIQYFSGVSLAM